MFFNINHPSIADLKAEALAIEQMNNSQSGWGKRLLNRHKVKDGIKYQLHATKGWRKVGRVEAAQ